METDRSRWNERYAGADVATEPSPPAGLDPTWVPNGGHGLDIACGRGAQAVWLAQRGLIVDALDISDVGLAGVRRLAENHGVADSIATRRADLDEGLPDGLADQYDLIVCQRFRDPRLYRPLADRLAPGGILVVTVLSAVGSTSPPGPFRAPAGELRTAFTESSLQTLADFEGDGEATIVVRRRQ